jgi:hypothetical protein
MKKMTTICFCIFSLFLTNISVKADDLELDDAEVEAAFEGEEPVVDDTTPAATETKPAEATDVAPESAPPAETKPAPKKEKKIKAKKAKKKNKKNKKKNKTKAKAKAKKKKNKN